LTEEQGIQGDDRMAAAQQRQDEHAAEISGRAGNEDFQWGVSQAQPFPISS
jgi:hypothetical protein